MMQSDTTEPVIENDYRTPSNLKLPVGIAMVCLEDNVFTVSLMVYLMFVYLFSALVFHDVSALDNERSQLNRQDGQLYQFEWCPDGNSHKGKAIEKPQLRFS